MQGDFSGIVERFQHGEAVKNVHNSNTAFIVEHHLPLSVTTQKAEVVEWIDSSLCCGRREEDMAVMEAAAAERSLRFSHMRWDKIRKRVLPYCV